MRINILVLVATIVLVVMPAGVQAQSDEGLVAEWHFDEGSGSVLKDSSGNGNDGEIHGATWVEGKYGKALSFDGVNDYVDLGTPVALDLQAPMTIEAWVKRASNGTHDDIISHGHAGYIFFIYGKNDNVVFGKQAEWEGAIIGSSRIIDVNWHHVVAVYGNSRSEIYVDGDLDNSGTSSARFSNTNRLYIGGCIDYGENFDGIIDEVRIYNRALAAEEIKEHYESGPTTLSLTKTASPQSIKQGQTTTITLTVKNTGSTEISDIEIADTIPSYLTFIDGETSKTYDSLAPKDTLQFYYTLQLNDAGTFNLEPAIATYADDKGNYNTVKSKPESIEVIRSIIENSAPTPKPTNDNAQSASVHLHGEKTDVVMGEDILLKLAAVNLITRPTMHVQVIITPPSGMSVTSSEFVQSGAGLFTASYEIEPGVGRDIEVRMRSNQVGDFVVNGRIVYYFGDDMDNAEDHTLTLPITVRAGAEPTDSSSESKESSTPGFGLVIAFMGLAAAGMVRGKIK